MKKLVLVAALTLAAISGNSQQQSNKTYSLQFSVEDLQLLNYIVDKTTAEHNYVVYLTGKMNRQISEQMKADTAKKEEVNQPDKGTSKKK